MFDSKADFMQAVYFNSDVYLLNKAAALNAQEYEGRSDWTAASAFKAIDDAGMTLWQHFSTYGAYERAADGGYGINPGPYFDLDAYYNDKMEECAENHGLHYAKQEIVHVFQSAGLDPITHYATYGYAEMLSPRMENMQAVEYGYGGMPLSGDYRIDSLLYAPALGYTGWNEVASSQGNVLYYSFAANMPDSYAARRNITRFDPLNEHQRTGVHEAAEYLGSITGIQFQFTENTDQANFLFFEAYDESTPNALGWAYGSAHINYTDPYFICITNPDAGGIFWRNNDLRKGLDTANYKLLLHEWGHALGLKHPFESASSVEATLPRHEDLMMYTTMSYTYPDPAEDPWYYQTRSQDYYSPYDLMALNYLYGTDGLNGNEGLVYHDTLAWV